MLHPVTLAALTALVVNDHVLKAAWSSWWTGKLSDVAGVLLLPPTIEHVGVRRTWALLATGAGFAAVKVCPAANAAWNGAFGWLYAAAGLGWTANTRMDATDLLALPFLGVWVWIGRRGR